MAGVDFLQLDPSAAPAGGLAGWLAGTLREAVIDGRLGVGARLPATRDLAGQLGVSRGVVVEAYQRLADEGLLSGRRGAGTVVIAGPLPSGGARQAAYEPVSQRPSSDMIDLSPGRPDLSAFPRAAWARAERAALAELADQDLGYGDPRGLLALREALTGWLAQTRGLRVTPDEIVIVNGVAQGLMLLARVLAGRGVTATGFEDPGSEGARIHLQRWGLEPEPIAVDSEGLDVAALAGIGLDTVVVTPAHQFPSGVVLSAARRRALVEWARAGTDRLVVEDDYDAEHRYDRPPVAALHTLAPDRVAHLGSVSKSLAPGIRLGWLVAPPQVREQLVEERYWLDLGSPVLPQLTLARLITSGAFERHLRLVRARHRARRDALVEAVMGSLPGASLHGVAAGLHVLVTLPDGVDDEAVTQKARERDVVVQPLSRHRMRAGPPGLVLGYAATTPGRLREAVARLAPLIPG